MYLYLFLWTNKMMTTTTTMTMLFRLTHNFNYRYILLGLIFNLFYAMDQPKHSLIQKWTIKIAQRLLYSCYKPQNVYKIRLSRAITTVLITATAFWFIFTLFGHIFILIPGLVKSFLSQTTSTTVTSYWYGLAGAVFLRVNKISSLDE